MPKNNSRDKYIYCDKCNYRTKRDRWIVKHVLSAHTSNACNVPQKYLCKQCNFSSNVKINFKLHMSKHRKRLLNSKPASVLNNLHSSDVQSDERVDERSPLSIFKNENLNINDKIDEKFSSQVDSFLDCSPKTKHVHEPSSLQTPYKKNKNSTLQYNENNPIKKSSMSNIFSKPTKTIDCASSLMCNNPQSIIKAESEINAENNPFKMLKIVLDKHEVEEIEVSKYFDECKTEITKNRCLSITNYIPRNCGKSHSITCTSRDKLLHHVGRDCSQHSSNSRVKSNQFRIRNDYTRDLNLEVDRDIKTSFKNMNTCYVSLPLIKLEDYGTKINFDLPNEENYAIVKEESSNDLIEGHSTKINLDLSKEISSSFVRQGGSVDPVEGCSTNMNIDLTNKGNSPIFEQETINDLIKLNTELATMDYHCKDNKNLSQIDISNIHLKTCVSRTLEPSNNLPLTNKLSMSDNCISDIKNDSNSIPLCNSICEEDKIAAIDIPVSKFQVDKNLKISGDSQVCTTPIRDSEAPKEGKPKLRHFACSFSTTCRNELLRHLKNDCPKHALDKRKKSRKKKPSKKIAKDLDLKVNVKTENDCLINLPSIKVEEFVPEQDMEFHNKANFPIVNLDQRLNNDQVKLDRSVRFGKLGKRIYTYVFTCRKCNLSTRRKAFFLKHMIFCNMDIKSDITQFICDGCTYSTSKKEIIRKHIHNCQYIPQIQRVWRKPIPEAKKKTLLALPGGSFTHICSFCGELFESLRNLVKHENIHIMNLPGALYCHECDYVTMTKSYLVRHLRTHAEKEFSCSFCSYKTHLKKRLSNHIMTHDVSRNKEFSCDLCSYGTHTQVNLDAHMKTHQFKDRYPCPHCEYKTYYKSVLKAHMRIHSDVLEFQCEHCPYKTRYKSSLTVHESAHTQHGVFLCPECPFKSMHKRTVRKHLQLKHPEKGNPRSFILEFREFKDEYEELVHKNSVGKKKLYIRSQRKFKCYFCEFTTYNKIALREHWKLHPEKAFHCEFCSFKTNISNVMRRHRSTHTRPLNLNCAFCKYETYDRSLLKSHMLVHSDEKSISCQECDYTTKYRAAILRHRQVRHNDRLKNLTCDHCDYKTDQRPTLIRHLDIHRTESLKCDYCDYTSLSLLNLNEHVKKHHHKEKLYKCPECNYAGYHSHNLSKHLEKHFGGQLGKI